MGSDTERGRRAVRVTRISTRNVKGRSERPEPLGRPAPYPSAERLTAAIERSLVDFPIRTRFIEDFYPQIIGAHDAAILRREEAARYAHWNDDEL